jgi:hypothetical protein
LGAAQSFAHDRLAEPALLVIRVRADRFEDRRAGHIVEPDRAERGQFPIRRDRDDIQIAAVERNTLDVFVPLPALVLFVRLVGMEGLPRKPAAGGQLALIAQGTDGVSVWGRGSGIGWVKERRRMCSALNFERW